MTGAGPVASGRSSVLDCLSAFRSLPVTGLPGGACRVAARVLRCPFLGQPATACAVVFLGRSGEGSRGIFGTGRRFFGGRGFRGSPLRFLVFDFWVVECSGVETHPSACRVGAEACLDGTERSRGPARAGRRGLFRWRGWTAAGRLAVRVSGRCLLAVMRNGSSANSVAGCCGWQRGRPGRRAAWCPRCALGRVPPPVIAKDFPLV
jgi:hypothetical protein